MLVTLSQAITHPIASLILSKFSFSQAPSSPFVSSFYSFVSLVSCASHRYNSFSLSLLYDLDRDKSIHDSTKRGSKRVESETVDLFRLKFRTNSADLNVWSLMLEQVCPTHSRNESSQFEILQFGLAIFSRKETTRFKFNFHFFASTTR